MIIGDGDAQLELAVVERRPHEIYFRATYTEQNFRGSVVVGDYMARDLPAMFRTMADNWRGFEGVLEWEELEGGLHLRATADTTGHVTIALTMVQYGRKPTRLEGSIMVEAGHLAAIAAELERLLGWPLTQRSNRE